MVERFHGIDRHRWASTVSVLNREGVDDKFVSLIYDFNWYVQTIEPEGVVAMETGVKAFYWADKIEAHGAKCFINKDGSVFFASTNQARVVNIEGIRKNMPDAKDKRKL